MKVFYNLGAYIGCAGGLFITAFTHPMPTVKEEIAADLIIFVIIAPLVSYFLNWMNRK